MTERRTERYKLIDLLVATVELPFTLKLLAITLKGLKEEMTYHRRLPETLADLVEVGQDFNEGLYEIFDGKVSYNPRIHKDDTQEGLGESDGASSHSTSLFLRSVTPLLRIIRLFR